MVSKRKAREILHDKTAHGKPLTERQRRFFGARAGGKPMPERNVPLFSGNLEPEVRDLGVPRWEEPLLGPSDAHVGPKGDLINQEALQARKGTSGPPNRGEAPAEWEPVQQDVPLTDADFHNKGGNDFRKGGEKNLAPWQQGAGPKELE